MTERGLPLEIRPRLPAKAPTPHSAADYAPTAAAAPLAGAAGLPAVQLSQAGEPPPCGHAKGPGPGADVLPAALSAAPSQGAVGSPSEVPLVLAPTGPVRALPDVPSIEEVTRIAEPAAKRPMAAVLGKLVVISAMALVFLWIVYAVVTWVALFTGISPVLGAVVYGLLGVLAAAGAVGLARQYRGYRRLDVLGALRQRLERARRCQISHADDEQLRRDFLIRVGKFHAAGAISAEARGMSLRAMADEARPGTWVEPATGHLLRDADMRVKELIEIEARLVGVGTALSPSGPLDTAIVLWRNVCLVLRIADAYHVRPGGLGAWRLLRRVATHTVAAGLSQEAMQMLYAAYGPAAVSVFSQMTRGACDIASKFGIALMEMEPVSGLALTAGATVGKGVADLTGAAAAQVTGPVLQGLLNAILTIRVGLAAQDECRLLPLDAQARRTQAAGIVSALVGYFRMVGRPQRFAGARNTAAGVQHAQNP